MLICNNCLFRLYANTIIDLGAKSGMCGECGGETIVHEVDPNYLSPSKKAIQANKYIQSQLKNKSPMAKIKTNLPYYEGMKTKVEAQVKSLEEQLASKKKEIESLNGIIDGLKVLEAKEAVEEPPAEEKR